MSKKRTTPPTPSPARPAGPASPMDVGMLEQMVKLMAAHDLNTVDVRDGERRVILKRGTAAIPAAATPALSLAPTGVAATAATAPPATPAPPASPDAGLVPIKSPMVGTFYAAPSPDAKPFVSVGSTVDEETDVCSIEAMKNFMPIKAGVRGTIAKVLVSNGQTVQFDAPLFLVKP